MFLDKCPKNMRDFLLSVLRQTLTHLNFILVFYFFFNYYVIRNIL